jgi:hypothetical protein
VRTISGATVLDAVITVTDAQGRQRGRTVACPNGRYTVSGLAAGDYTVVASSPGFRPDVTTVNLNGRGATHDGAADFRVVGQANADGLFTGWVDDVVGGEDQVGGGAAPDRHRRHVLLSGLPLGQVTVTASGPAPARRHRRGDRPRRSSRSPRPLPSIGGLVGTVLAPDGSVVAEATVTASDARGDIIGSTRSDADGRYRLADLAPGRYMVVATTYAPAAVQVHVLPVRPPM